MVQLVTVFGGSGFVGKQVVRALAKAGFRVRVVVRHPDQAYDLKPMGDVGQIQIMRGDIRKAADVGQALEGAFGVVNLVGILYQTLGQSFKGVHRDATKAVAEQAKALGISKFVQISAIGADPKSPSAYSQSKGEAEQALRKLIPTAVILRPSLVFGPGDGFFTALASQTRALPFLPAIGGAKTRFQPVYVGDVAQSVATVMSVTDYDGQIFELGGPRIYSFKELMTYVGQQVYAPRPLIYMPYFVASLIGVVGDLQAMLTPLPPVLTTDQVRLLQKDNVVSEGAKTLKDLGIALPTAVETIVPDYLWRFRTGGQFAKPANHS
jgi:uncharacterized protein YbjT (DUF2867 family)